MPLIYGKYYTERKDSGLQSQSFRIYIEVREYDEKLIDCITEILRLKTYLKEVNPALKITIICQKIFDELVANSDDLIIDPRDFRPDSNKKTIVDNNSVDLVIAASSSTIDYFNKFNNLNCVVKNVEEALGEIEIFVRGHEIPWSFTSENIWYRPWTTFYNMGDEFGKKSYELYSEKLLKIISKESAEILRSLLMNRIAMICYSRDKLFFFLQQKRYAKRQGWKNQDYSFETSFYLSHFYTMLYAGLDQLARIVDDALNMETKKDIWMDLGNEIYRRKVAIANSELGKIFLDAKFVEWVEKLKIRRNFVAHEGCITPTTLLEKPDHEPTDAELEKEAKSTQDWEILKETLPDELLNWYLKSLKETLKVSKYRVMQDDIVYIKDKRSGKGYIFKPLIGLTWDINNFEIILMKALKVLAE